MSDDELTCGATDITGELTCSLPADHKGKHEDESMGETFAGADDYEPTDAELESYYRPGDQSGDDALLEQMRDAQRFK